MVACNKWGVCFICMILVLTECCFSENSQDNSKAFLEPDMILEAWESHYGNIGSMRVHFTETVEESKQFDESVANGRLSNLVRHQSVERIEEGAHYHIRYSTSPEGFDNAKSICENSFDGDITREYWTAKKRGRVIRGLTGRNVEKLNAPKMYMLLSNVESYDDEHPEGRPKFKWLMETAPDHSVVVKPALEVIAGYSCHVLEITKNFKVWVAHELGMLPLKYQRFNKGILATEIEVKEVGISQSVRGKIWFPANATRTLIKKDHSTRYRLHTTLFEPDVKVDKETFKFKFPNGTRVADHLLRLDFTVGGDQNHGLQFEQGAVLDEAKKEGHEAKVGEQLESSFDKPVVELNNNTSNNKLVSEKGDAVPNRLHNRLIILVVAVLGIVVVFIFIKRALKK